MATLTQIGYKYGTDKAPVLTTVYSKFMEAVRNDPVRILEVGVFFGASLKMWNEYFPTGQIYGIDTFEGNQGNGSHFNNSRSFLTEASKYPRIYAEVCDQSSREDLEQYAATITEPFDFIIDDGSHLMKDQQQTLAVLWKLVKPGGIYFIEDYASSFDTRYPDVLPDFSNTTATMMDTYKKTGQINSVYMTDEERDLLSREILKIDTTSPNTAAFYKRDL